MARSPKCPEQPQQSKRAKRGMKCIEEKRFIYWGEPQRAPQLRDDLDFRHSRYISIYLKQ